jgi:hypothetical protein
MVATASAINNEEQHEISKDDVNFDRKLDLITEGAMPYIKEHLLTKITRENCLTIINYVLAMQCEVNPSVSTRINNVYKLKLLAGKHNPKPFKDMTRQDIIEYLDTLRKPESVDPMHKWIGTYEMSRVILLRFFR